MTTPARVGLALLAAALIAACAAPTVNRSQRSFALIVSGDVVSLSSAAYGSRVGLVEVDGAPAKEMYGPVQLAPGRHTVKLSCGGTSNAQTLTMAAGEIYQFSARTTPGVKGCSGALSRVRTSNP